MNVSKYVAGIALLLAVVTGCKKEVFDDVSFVEAGLAPEQLSALFEITQDNTGLVTITPNGTGAVSYEVFFGDATTIPANIVAGKNTTHTYAEGVYNVKLLAHAVNGKTFEALQPLTVSFKAPENLVVNAAVDAVDNFKLNISASATYETMFRVYWGDVPNEVPQTFLEGGNISHTYTTVGVYEVRVVALSGGAATTSFTTNITITDPVLLPVTFQSATQGYNFINFDGGAGTVIDNPQVNGINTSTKVARMIKNAGQPWGGTILKLGAPIDFSANRVFRMKVYSPRVGAKVLLKVEDPTNGAISFEKEVSTSVANAWEDLVFNYNGINTANVYQNLVIIFDNGTVGDGSANFTFLFDDIRLTNQVPTVLLNLPVSFDVAGVNYAVTDFGNNITFDDVDPTDAGNKVKKTTKPAAAPTWAGTTIGAGFTSKIPFTASTTQMSVRVYSPAGGIRVRLKVEDRTNNSKSVETEAMTLAANTWETLIFDFANQSAGTAALNLSYTYDMASLFFDFGNEGSGKVFYWDDVQFLPANVTPSYLALPLDFQSAVINYDFSNFGGGNASVVNNPSATGINTSTMVGKMVKAAGEVYGGSVIALVNPMNFSTKKTFTMKVYSPRVGAKVLLKVEGPGAAFEREVTTTTANTWELLTFDFSDINAGLSYQAVVLIFDLGTMGDGSANFTWYFDDISLN